MNARSLPIVGNSLLHVRRVRSAYGVGAEVAQIHRAR